MSERYGPSPLRSVYPVFQRSPAWAANPTKEREKLEASFGITTLRLYALLEEAASRCASAQRDPILRHNLVIIEIDGRPFARLKPCRPDEMVLPDHSDHAADVFDRMAASAFQRFGYGCRVEHLVLGQPPRDLTLRQLVDHVCRHPCDGGAWACLTDYLMETGRVSRQDWYSDVWFGFSPSLLRCHKANPGRRGWRGTLKALRRSLLFHVHQWEKKR